MSLEYPNPNLRNINSTDPIGKVGARLEDLKPIIDEVNRIADAPAPSGGIETIVAGTGISVDNTDPANPIITNVANYKSYVALLTQTGTDAPKAIVLENTLSNDITLSYDSVGYYYLNSPSGAFINNKTFAGSPNGFKFGVIGRYCFLNYEDEFTMGILTSFTSSSSPTAITYENDILNNTPIEIRVYN